VKRYWRFLVPAGLLIAVLVVLVVNLSANLVYFNTPTELLDEGAAEARLRLGGEVLEGSVEDTAEGVAFLVTDGRENVAVRHVGSPQDLFQEGIGVVVEGTWDGAVFDSDTMLVKHDEQYRTEDGEVYVPGEDMGTAGPQP
jgi:cytochrome c-type biogenesis protein CcmE